MRLKACLLLTILLSTATSAAAEPLSRALGPGIGHRQGGELRPELALTPQRVVELALRNHLGLKVARQGPVLAAASVSVARSELAPQAFALAGTVNSKAPSTSDLFGEPNIVRDRTSLFDVGVSKRFRFGTVLSLDWEVGRQRHDSLFSRFDPTLRASTRATIEQPLLRSRGRDPIHAAIQVAEKEQELSEIELDAAIARTRHQSLYAYWQWSHAQDLLVVQRESLELARELLHNNEERVSKGSMAPVDLIGAEAEVAQRVEAIVIGDQRLAAAEERLRALIFDPADADFSTTSLRRPPVDEPSLGEPEAPVLEKAVTTALDRRLEVRAAQKELEIGSVRLRRFRLDSLPEVVLELGYQKEAIGGTQILRGPGFPGPVIGQERHDLGAVIGDLPDSDFSTWSAQIAVRTPLGAGRTDTLLELARLQQEQLEISLRAIELDVETEVKIVALEVAADRKRLEPAQEAVRLAERRLEGEQQKFTVGLSTNFFVFQAQRDLALAREALLRAQLDYRLATVDLETVQVVSLQLASPVEER